MAAEDWIDVYDYCDAEYWVQNNEPTKGGDRTVARIQTGPRVGDGAEFDREHSKAEIKANKFYVGHPRIFRDNWGHPTLDEAIEHARELMEEDDRRECFVVQIVTVVKRKKQPITVQRVG